MESIFIYVHIEQTYVEGNLLTFSTLQTKVLFKCFAHQVTRLGK